MLSPVRSREWASECRFKDRRAAAVLPSPFLSSLLPSPFPKGGRARNRASATAASGHAHALLLVLPLSLISAARSVGRLLAMRVGGRSTRKTESYPSLFVRTWGKGGPRRLPPSGNWCALGSQAKFSTFCERSSSHIQIDIVLRRGGQGRMIGNLEKFRRAFGQRLSSDWDGFVRNESGAEVFPRLGSRALWNTASSLRVRASGARHSIVRVIPAACAQNGESKSEEEAKQERKRGILKIAPNPRWASRRPSLLPLSIVPCKGLSTIQQSATLSPNAQSTYGIVSISTAIYQLSPEKDGLRPLELWVWHSKNLLTVVSANLNYIQYLNSFVLFLKGKMMMSDFWNKHKKGWNVISRSKIWKRNCSCEKHILILLPCEHVCFLAFNLPLGFTHPLGWNFQGLWRAAIFGPLGLWLGPLQSIFSYAVFRRARR